MNRRPHRVRATATMVAALACLIFGQLMLAGPVSAHAELVATSPANGQRLAQPPREVTLRFTENVGLIDDGLQLLNARTGDRIRTPDPIADGSRVHLPLPADLPDGSYLVNWRVVSGDSHPVTGAFSFGVGADPSDVADTTATPGAPWPVTAVRWVGYLGFAVAAGVVAFASVCWPRGRGERRLVLLLTSGLVVTAAGSLVGLLLQGPYVAGAPLSRSLDPAMMAHVAHSGFGAWTQLRLVLCLAMAAVLWGTGALTSAVNRWGAGGGIVALAVTFSGTGHAAGSGSLLDRGVDTVHVLAAASWVGGLVSLAVLSVTRGPRPTVEALVRFSRLAFASVLVLVGTGAVNALLRLDTIEQLWQSRYGQLLSLKLGLVLAVLGTAALSRRTVARGGGPWRPVRVEAVGTVAVLAVTSLLALTPPPGAPSGAARGDPAAPTAPATTVTMNLGEGGHARLDIDGLTTTGSRLRLHLLGRDHAPLAVSSVSLRAALPARAIGPIQVPLTRSADRWHGDFKFPLPGRWELTLTVEDRQLDAVVTAGTVIIR